MKALVQKVIENYPRYLQEEGLFEYHLKMRENSDMRDALTELKIKISVVESWFALLNDVDERFALRQALQPERNDTPAHRAAATMWMWRLIKTGETPLVIREQAIEKIVAFASDHREMMRTMFSDLLSSDVAEGRRRL